MTKTCAWCGAPDVIFKVFLADEEFANEHPFLNEDDEQLRACEHCTKKWSGQRLSRPAPDSPKFRLVMEHEDFEKLEFADLKKVAFNMPCRLCGEQIAQVPDEAFTVARKMLRLVPGIVLEGDVEEFYWTCRNCGADCPDCLNGEEHYHADE